MFDAVILDHKMPRLNGIEVAKEIIKINPRQRIIISSAHSREVFFIQEKEAEKLENLYKNLSIFTH